MSSDYKEPQNRRRYVVTGGHVVGDKDTTWITPSHVVGLYKVRAKDCYIIHDISDLHGLSNRTDLIWLQPQNFARDYNHLPTRTTSYETLYDFVETYYPKPKVQHESETSEGWVNPKTNPDRNDNEQNRAGVSSEPVGESGPVPRQDVQPDWDVVCEALHEAREDAGADDPDGV